MQHDGCGLNSASLPTLVGPPLSPRCGAAGSMCVPEIACVLWYVALAPMV